MIRTQPAPMTNFYVTRETLEGTSYDHLGFDIQNRDFMIANRIRLSFKPFFNVLAARPELQRPPQEKPVEPLLRYNCSFRAKDVQLNHFQLHYCVRAASEQAVLYTTDRAIMLLDLAAKSARKLRDAESSDNLSVDPFGRFVATSMNRNCWALLNLQTADVEIKRRFDDLVNSSCFLDAASIVVGGNFANCDVLDLDCSKVKHTVTSRANVNHIDHSAALGLLSLAMDHCDVDLADPRAPLPVLALKGHLDFNFCGKFLGDYRLATGGQDITTRVWDVRRPERALLVLPGSSSGISALEHHAEKDILFAVEVVGVFHQYHFLDEEVAHSTLLYPSAMVGLSLTPSGEKIVLGVAACFVEGYSGLVVFDV